MQRSNLSLDFFPQERARLADELLNGTLTSEEYFLRLRELEDTAKREDVRNEVGKVLSGMQTELPLVLPPDPLDAKMDAHLASKFKNG